MKALAIGSAFLAFGFTITFAVATGSVTAVREPVVSVNANCRCNQDVHDRFETPVAFAFGYFKGQCVNSCKFRRIHLVEGAEAKRYGADATHLVATNLLHDRRYWVARIPVGASTEVDVELERFFSSISHFTLRYRFNGKDTVELFPQANPNGGPAGRPTRIHDLVISAEAVPPKNHEFALSESSVGQYLLDYRLLSIDDTVKWMVVEKRHNVRQYRLHLPPEPREKILRRALSAAEQNSFAAPYELFSRNCATSVLDIIESQLGYRATLSDSLWLRQWQRAIPVDLPFGTVTTLSAMRLIDDHSRLPNLEEEFPQQEASSLH